MAHNRGIIWNHDDLERKAVTDSPGDIYSDFDMNLQKRKPQVEKSDKDGMYKVFREDWMYGTINGGGPEFLFTTVHGNIYFRTKH